MQIASRARMRKVENPCSRGKPTHPFLQEVPLNLWRTTCKAIFENTYLTLKKKK